MRALVVLTASALMGLVACQQSEQAPPEKPADKATAATAAAAPASEDAGEVVATYGGKRLTTGRITKEMERLPAPSRAYLAAPDRKKQFVENMILNDLLYDQGQKLGYDKDEEIDRQVNDLRRRLVIQRLVREYQKTPEVTDEQAKQYYDQNQSLYSSTQIRASHILVKDEATARDILDQVKRDPGKFADLAKDKSIDKTSAIKGGDLGTFGQGRMVPEFERAAFALKQGEISDVVKTQYGYHVIMITERKEGEARPFDQVKDQIKATLRNKTLQEQQESRYNDLKQQANLKIDDMMLDKIEVPQGQTAADAALGRGH
jgi:peptidyl-prolyl cis-trans isomerase C